MRATWRHPEAFVGFGGEHVAIPFAEGRGAFPKIHQYIEHRAGGDPHELPLGRGAALVVQATENILCGAAVVVLHEIGADAELGEGFLVPRFEEKTARVAENTRPEQERPVDFCGIASHGKIRNLVLSLWDLRTDSPREAVWRGFPRTARGVFASPPSK